MGLDKQEEMNMGGGDREGGGERERDLTITRKSKPAYQTVADKCVCMSCHHGSQLPPSTAYEYRSP